MQANDRAHKAMLRDLIPMVALHGRHTEKQLSDFTTRYNNLLQFSMTSGRCAILSMKCV